MKSSLLWSACFLAAFLLTQLIGAAAIILLTRQGLAPSPEISLILSLAVANLLAILLFFVLKPRDLTWHTTCSGLRYPGLRHTLLGIMMAPSVIILVNLSMEPFDIPDIIDVNLMTGLMRNPWGILVVTLVGPIAEELIFRGGILHHLMRGTKEPWVAILVSALVFALIHGNPAQMPGAFLLGILLGWTYVRSGSLLAPIFIHVFNNALGCCFPCQTMSDIFGGWVGAGIAAAVALVWLGVMISQARHQLPD